jgi:CheY-like chemotaxis protein
VILCDLMMPDMTGMDLHAELARKLPEQATRMIFLTGGAFTPRAREFLDEVPNQRLEKPCDLGKLLALINDCSGMSRAA